MIGSKRKNDELQLSIEWSNEINKKKLISLTN